MSDPDRGGRHEISGAKCLIDDIEANRDILARNFQRRGFDVSQASSGQDGLALINAYPFDIVMLDIMMPAMCGLEVLRNIGQRYSAGKLPVIMVTARSKEENIAEALELGANDYITKPVNVPIARTRA